VISYKLGLGSLLHCEEDAHKMASSHPSSSSSTFALCAAKPRSLVELIKVHLKAFLTNSIYFLVFKMDFKIQKHGPIQSGFTSHVVFFELKKYNN
jgi:hypothetical protein